MSWRRFGSLQEAVTASEAALPLFFFHLCTPDGVDRADEGLALPDLDTAYLKACEAIPGMAAEFLSRGANPLDYGFFIADQSGVVLMDVPFAERTRSRRRLATPEQQKRTHRLAGEIADIIISARKTIRQSQLILARAQAPQ